MRDFWHFARRLTRQRALLAGAVVCAAISAGGLGAGLVATLPVLRAVLGQGESLAQMLRRLSADWPAWARPGEGLLARLPESPYAAVVWIIAALALLTLVGAAANFLHAYLAQTLVARVVGAVRSEGFARAVRLPLARVHELGPSDVVSRLVYDAQALGAGLGALLSKALAQVTKGAAALAAAFVVEWRVALGSMLVAPLLAVIIRKLGKRIRRASRAALSAQGELYQSAAEALAPAVLRVVKAQQAEGVMAARFAARSDEAVVRELRVRTVRAASGPIVEVLTIFVLGGLALVVVKAILDGHVAPEAFILALGSLGVAGASLKPLTGLMNDIQAAAAAGSRLRAVLDAPVEGPRRHDDSGAGPLPPIRHTLVFDRVSVTYPGRDRPALERVTLTIHAGQTVAFVGPNGCGKTTLLALVPRWLDPDPPAAGDAHAGSPGGRVLIDGHDLRAVTLDSLRAQIGVVTQESPLIAGTIRENIALGAEPTPTTTTITTTTPPDLDRRVQDAARRAHAHAFILERPGGYDSPIGEGGTGLSGGQRQRLAIARALFRDPALLILDEATSMIDAESEAAIARAVADFVADHARPRTCLIVAHRLSTVVHADRIVVLDQGRLVDSGRHDELLARCTLYQQLVRHQMIPAATA